MDVSKSSNFESEILQEEIVDFEDMESIGKDGIFVSELSSKSVSEAMLISSNLGSHFFDDKMDEMRLMGSENNQNELMKFLSDLQEENIYLLQRVSGLEAQLRYFADKSKMSRLELQSYGSIVMILESQIKELEEENESQKVKEKAKLYEMEKKWLEAEEACLSLGKVNIRLQSTTENLMEEYNSLQKFNIELREQTRRDEEICSKSTSESHDSYQPQVQISHEQSNNGFAEALEGNDAYKAQLESVSVKKSRESERKVSQFEKELQEIRERYFEMSLNYAEVEDQREQLVMKLKSFNI